jgi:flavin-dependent dehydrogenase
VGDAAAQTNPLTFGGLRNSMVAGKMAAQAIVSGNIQDYDRSWYSSKYASPYFWDAFIQLQAMNNQELMETVEHMGQKATVLNNIGAYIRKKKLRRIIWAYMLAQNYGW